MFQVFRLRYQNWGENLEKVDCMSSPWFPQPLHQLISYFKSYAGVTKTELVVKICLKCDNFHSLV